MRILSINKTAKTSKEYVEMRSLCGGLRGKRFSKAFNRYCDNKLNDNDRERIKQGYNKIDKHVRNEGYDECAQFLRLKHAAHKVSHANGGSDTWDNMMWQDKETNMSYSSENMSNRCKVKTYQKNYLDAERIVSGKKPLKGGSYHKDGKAASMKKMRDERNSEIKEIKETNSDSGGGLGTYIMADAIAKGAAGGVGAVVCLMAFGLAYWYILEQVDPTPEHYTKTVKRIRARYKKDALIRVSPLGEVEVYLEHPKGGYWTDNKRIVDRYLIKYKQTITKEPETTRVIRTTDKYVESQHPKYDIDENFVAPMGSYKGTAYEDKDKRYVNVKPEKYESKNQILGITRKQR